MTLASFQIEIRSPDTGAITQVFDGTTFHEIRYSRVLNDIGALVLSMPADDDLPALFPPDTLIEIKRTSPETGRLIVEETYFARMTHRFQENNEERFLIGGLSLNHLIARRVVNPADDPFQAGGYSTKSGAADSVMREYALQQMGANASAARQFPFFSVGLVEGVGLSVGRRLRFENLFAVFQDIAKQSMIDFRVSRTDGNNLELQIGRIGSDKTQTANYPSQSFVLLDPVRGNMVEPSLLLDRRKEGNYLYAMAQGAGENRLVWPFAGYGVTDSPWNRIEFAEDIRTSERGNAIELLTEARKLLKNKERTIEFSFQLSGDQPGNVYRLDWDIGDSITAQWGDVSQDLRVKSIEITATSSGENLQVTTELL